MSRKIFAWVLLIALVLPLALGACKTATEAPEPTEPPAVAPTDKPVEPTEKPPAPPVEPMEPAVDPSGQTVIFWHVWYRDPVRQGMVDLVDEFNATNEWGITVEAYDQGNYSDTEDLFNAAIQSGDLPDVVVAYGNALSNWNSVEIIIDLDPYVEDADFGLTAEEKADFYPAAFNGAVTPEGARVGFPISSSASWRR